MAPPKLIFAAMHKEYKYEEIDSSIQSWEFHRDHSPGKVTSDYNEYHDRIESKNAANKKLDGQSRITMCKFATMSGADERKLRSEIERLPNFHSWM